MSTETNEKSNAERLLEQATRHLETRATYMSLVAVEKGSEILASAARLVVVAVFAGLILFFFSMGFAFWLSERLHSQAGGFSLAGLIFIPFAVAAWVWVKHMVRAKIIQTFLDDDDIQPKDAPAQPAGITASESGTESPD
jgi:uncharacterized phosphosugar-binding protein